MKNDNVKYHVGQEGIYRIAKSLTAARKLKAEIRKKTGKPQKIFRVTTEEVK